MFHGKPSRMYEYLHANFILLESKTMDWYWRGFDHEFNDI